MVKPGTLCKCVFTAFRGQEQEPLFNVKNNFPACLNEENCEFGISWLNKKNILIKSCHQFSKAFEQMGFGNYSSIYVTF